MAQVIIRNLDPKVVEALRERAKRNGRSLEAELRLLLARDAGLERSAVREPGAPYRATFKKTPAKTGSTIHYPKEFKKLEPFTPIKSKGKLASRLLIEDRG